MITQMDHLPGHVLGFTASGTITADDYESVLIPAIEAMLQTSDSVRLLYHIDPGCAGFELAAMWDDAKLGMKHFTAWERVAVVSENAWLRSAVKLMGFAMPGHVRVFDEDELAEATEWVAA